MFLIFPPSVKMQHFTGIKNLFTVHYSADYQLWSDNYLLRKSQPTILKYAVGGEGGLSAKRMQLQNASHDIVRWPGHVGIGW